MRITSGNLVNWYAFHVRHHALKNETPCIEEEVINYKQSDKIACFDDVM